MTQIIRFIRGFAELRCKVCGGWCRWKGSGWKCGVCGKQYDI